MPSAKYLFLTREDEAALSTLLRSKFPDIQFLVFSGASKSDWRFVDGIQDTEEHWLSMVVSPADWQPKLEKYSWGGWPQWAVTNFPELTMSYDRSVLREREIYQGRFHVGRTDVLTKGQSALAGKVWRLLAKIGSYRLCERLPERSGGGFLELTGKRFFAGNDAIRWALQDDRRFFGHTNRCLFRPVTDQTRLMERAG